MDSNSFLKTLADLEKGKAANDLSEALTELVLACKTVGKKGELAVKLIVKPSGDGETIRFALDFKAKKPLKDRKETTFFVSYDGQLSRDNPRQSEIEFKAMPSVPSSEQQLNAAHAGK